MKQLKYLIGLLIVAALTNVCDAAEGIRIRSRGFRFDMKPADKYATSSGPIATADCVVRVNRHPGVVLHWGTKPFTHTSFPEITSDAFLAARVTRQNRKTISVSPRLVIDRTDISGGDDTAGIAMGVKGSGKANIELQIGINDNNAAAGKHFTTVVLTVTGN